MKRVAAYHLKTEKGQSLVEFTFIISVLILILMGVFDFGRAFYAYNAISNAAREGARYGTVCPYDTTEKQCQDSDGFPPYNEPDTIEGRAVAQVFALSQDQFRVRVRFPDPERIEDQFCVDNPFDPACLNSDPTTGDPIEVTVIYRFYALTPLIDKIWGGGPLPLRSTALMFIE